MMYMVLDLKDAYTFYFIFLATLAAFEMCFVLFEMHSQHSARICSGLPFQFSFV